MGCDHSEGRSTGHSEDVRTVREDLLGAAVKLGGATHRDRRIYPGLTAEHWRAFDTAARMRRGFASWAPNHGYRPDHADLEGWRPAASREARDDL